SNTSHQDFHSFYGTNLMIGG
nr:RecName: Full=Cytochrome c oxidase subunit 7B-liver, mitochondrial; AltName: Full=Cytochrome c oxidase polypeptide VIIb-liver [Thunnus obesus]